jgi:branched-subunit amino acid aminotransferase/4-amino-4-deoxychorismate lyase
MIWLGGRVISDDEFTVSARDRTFEHGLGLFETLRTWNGHATLLDRHLARLTRSARELGLPLACRGLPDQAAIRDLLSAEGIRGDAALRITLSGGESETQGGVLWMRAAPVTQALPEPCAGAIAVDSELTIDERDRLARHKTLNYWGRRLAFGSAHAVGADEALVRAKDRHAFLEGTRSSLFTVEGGTVVTTGLESPILPGVMRGVVLDFCRSLGLQVDLRSHVALPNPVQDDVRTQPQIDEIFLTNAVRGIIPVSRALGVAYPAPGPITRRLWCVMLPWLERGGEP